MIEIKDLFGDINLGDYKTHFAIGGKGRDNDVPLRAFKRNEFQEWQNIQKLHNFEKDYIFSLIYYKKGEWMFAGIYKVISSKEVNDRIRYETKLLDKYEDLIGRLIIGFDKEYRQSYPYLANVYEQFKFVEILRDRASIDRFPGFENLNICFSDLQFIIENEEESWKSALSNIQGVYLISDMSNGKLYVGATYGGDAFWNRWKEYITKGTGDNIELKRLLEEKGFDHTSNFTFSILEVHSKTTDKNYIIQREQHWKNILLTKEFGYNKN